MDYYALVSQIYPDADFNPACFSMSEEEARAAGMWRDPRPMPTIQALKAAEDSLVTFNQTVKLKKLFIGIRKLWQALSDQFAAENAAMGITQEKRTREVADKFKEVVYYLNVNAPKEALAEIDKIQRDSKYLTEERLTALKNKLIEFINANS